MLEQNTLIKYGSIIFSYLEKQAGITMILIDHDHRIIDCNDTFQSLTVEKVKPVGKHLNDYLRDPWEQRRLDKEGHFQVLMASRLGIAFAISGQVYPVNEGELILGTRAVSADETIIEKISMLSTDMSNLTRELSKKNVALEKANARISSLLRTDTLTGIANRRYFYETLQKGYAYASRQDMPLSLVMADLDYFKRINDTYGHPVGDRVLIAFARLLQENCRAEDLAARFGGEEFIVVLTHAGCDEAVTYAQRICDRVPKMVVPEVEFDITASFGVAERRNEESPEDLINRADEAMYRAKKRGRNRVEI